VEGHAQLLKELALARGILGHELQAAPRGTLRVTAPVVAGTHLLVPVVAQFLAAFPEVRVELALHDRIVDLVDEGFDVALRSGTSHAPGFVARPIAPLRMLLAASPKYLRAHGTPRKLRRFVEFALQGLGPTG